MHLELIKNIVNGSRPQVNFGERRWLESKEFKCSRLKFILLFKNTQVTEYMIYTTEAQLRGYCTPNLKLACFVCRLKIINTFRKKNNEKMKKKKIKNVKVKCPRNSKMALLWIKGKKKR